MNFTKLFVGTLIGGVVYFLLGWLVYGILLMDVMSIPEEFNSILYSEEEFNMVFMAVSCLVWGLLLTYVLLSWGGIKSFGAGLLPAAIIGALVALSLGFSMASMYKFSEVPNVLIDSVATAVISGITGGVIGWYLGRGKAGA
ncbi:MAG: hypothetical protein DWQ02_06590 [Bacteroidetes bacterium]|nr:MAG: hypothetical protein DWQ02_06590 [Bacteroidota bacterium]